jgi:eukaryotic-like serine/threonine-protein kinase
MSLTTNVVSWTVTNGFSGISGVQNAGNLYKSLHARPSLSGHSYPARRATSTADPDDSPVNGPFHVDDSLLLFRPRTARAAQAPTNHSSVRAKQLDRHGRRRGVRHPGLHEPRAGEGRLDRLSPASDVYSLGAMLYTLLCGCPPFEYAWCEVTTLLARVKNGEFAPPRQVNPRVPKPLEAVCLKAMAKGPEDRYVSAEDLAVDIERWLGDEPVCAYREPRWARMLRWGRRHRPLVAGAAALLLTAVAGLSLGIILLGRALCETEAQRQSAVQERELATLMSREANTRADSLRRRDYISRVNLANREFLDDNAGLAEELLYGCPSNLRNWEWSHVQRLAHLELDTSVNADTPQRQDVWSLAFSPDGRRLVSGSGPWYLPQSSATAALVVREVDSGREVFKQRGWNGAVQAVAFSPDGQRVVAGTGTTGAVTGLC